MGVLKFCNHQLEAALNDISDGPLVAGTCPMSYSTHRPVHDVSRRLRERNSNHTQYWKNFVRETDSNLKM
jgi:hypothetical protein